jgi:uncharacterized protein (TIGR00251 family)
LNGTAASAWFAWQGAELVLTLTVQPGAKRDGFVGPHGATFRVRIRAPAVDGKANQSLIEFLAEEFGTPRAAVRLVRGHTSKSKVVRVAAPQRLPAALQTHGLSR